ncbi:hypothetical protein [Jeotgalibaca ciconiae]|nr:hypothetical protein [Jeotgalibaca ciconiae]
MIDYIYDQPNRLKMISNMKDEFCKPLVEYCISFEPPVRRNEPIVAEF